MTDADATRRVEALADDGQDVVAVVKTGETEAREFYAAVRVWDHPDEPDTSVLSLQNAQLTADWSDMSDTWLSGGYRQRVPDDDGTVARQLAQSLAATAAQQDADTLGEHDVETFDATGDQ